MANTPKGTKVQTTTTKPSKASPSIEVLTRKVEALQSEITTLEKSERLASIGMQGARLGHQMPPGMSDPLEAFQWLQSVQARVGQVHTSTTLQDEAARQIQNEILTPIQLDLAEQKLALRSAKEELAQAVQLVECESAPALIEDHRRQIKTLTTSASHHKSNVDRLAKDAAALTTQIAELAGVEAELDSKLSEAIESGTQIDDAELMSVSVQRQTLAKRLQLTQQAHQKAKQALKLDQTDIDQHKDEISRLERVTQARKAADSIKALIDALAKDGILKSVISDQLKAAAAI